MKILDFKKKGNAIRFYLGKDELKDWYGDDWNDVNDEDRVYDEFVDYIIDITLPYTAEVLNLFDFHQFTNCLCKDDLKEWKYPMLVIIPNFEKYSQESHREQYDFICKFEEVLGYQDRVEVFMGDDWEHFLERLTDKKVEYYLTDIICTH